MGDKLLGEIESTCNFISGSVWEANIQNESTKEEIRSKAANTLSSKLLIVCQCLLHSFGSSLLYMDGKQVKGAQDVDSNLESFNQIATRNAWPVLEKKVEC